MKYDDKLEEVSFWGALLVGALRVGGQAALGLAASYGANVLYDAFKKRKGKPITGIRVWRISKKYRHSGKVIKTGKEYKLLRKKWSDKDVDYVIVGAQTGKHYYLIKAIGDYKPVENALKKVLDERQVGKAIQRELKKAGFNITVPQPIPTEQKRERKARKQRDYASPREEMPKRTVKEETVEEKHKSPTDIVALGDKKYLLIAGVGIALLFLLGAIFILTKR